MDRKELKTAFKKVFFVTLKKNGFKKINKKWVFETDDLIKEVELQKSDYSDKYYLNYKFSVKGIDTSPFLSHVFSRFGVKSKVLDLESNLTKEERLDLFEHTIDEMVEAKIKPVNTIADILQLMKERPSAKNMLSKAFKEHFDIKD